MKGKFDKHQKVSKYYENDCGKFSYKRNILLVLFSRQLSKGFSFIKSPGEEFNSSSMKKFGPSG